MGEITAGLVLLALVLAAAGCLRTRTATAAWLLAGCAALWPPTDKSLWEGPVLVPLNLGHGVTASDLLAVGGFLLAGWVLWRLQPTRRRPGRVAGLALLALGGIAAAYAFQS